jgi:hypothetical protein
MPSPAMMHGTWAGAEAADLPLATLDHRLSRGQRPYLQIPRAPVTKQSPRGAWKTILKSYAPRYRLASH